MRGPAHTGLLIPPTAVAVGPPSPGSDTAASVLPPLHLYGLDRPAWLRISDPLKLDLIAFRLLGRTLSLSSGVLCLSRERTAELDSQQQREARERLTGMMKGEEGRTEQSSSARPGGWLLGTRGEVYWLEGTGEGRERAPNEVSVCAPVFEILCWSLITV